MKFSQTCPPFASHSGPDAAERHSMTARDAVEDLLEKMIASWTADDLYLAPQMADTLRAPLLDLLAGGTERLRAECARMYEQFRQLEATRRNPFES